MTPAEPELTPPHTHTHRHIRLCCVCVCVCVHRKALDWLIKCMSELRLVSDTSVWLRQNRHTLSIKYIHYWSNRTHTHARTHARTHTHTHTHTHAHTSEHLLNVTNESHIQHGLNIIKDLYRSHIHISCNFKRFIFSVMTIIKVCLTSECSPLRPSDDRCLHSDRGYWCTHESFSRSLGPIWTSRLHYKSTFTHQSSILAYPHVQMLLYTDE